ncbi:MAG: hypothetical protein LAN61_05765 [Acidobacteriia bacterium]|nr:hypothetical protein [Terriglobia bacterium]
MQPATIYTLKPNVTREEAIRILEPRGLRRLLAPALRNFLLQVADAYVPYRLYQVRLAGMSGKAPAQTRLFALDAAQGTLDLFEFPRIPGEEDLLRVETRNRLEASLEEARGQALLAEKVLRIVFQQGFFRVREPRLEIQRMPLDFHMPYWLGFYGADGALKCHVLDAVRRRMEGAKARTLFEDWLAA